MKTTRKYIYYAQRNIVPYIILCFFILLTGHETLAQQDINTTFKSLMDNTFQNLEKNRVPHGILIDFGIIYPLTMERLQTAHILIKGY